MHKVFLRLAAFLGAFSVMLGAFAAHGLKKNVNADAVLIFETAVRYQFYHVFALALTAILYKEYLNKWLKRAGILFVLGIVFFSGSLYILTYAAAVNFQGLKFVGVVTPIGGLLFIGGWLCLGAGIKRDRTL
jgi:uncharacterized membrane protein YgdD (TMEM256/DUF423 family)